MVIKNEFLMLFLMLLQDNIFFYILTIKKLFASLSFIAKQYKLQDVNKICQDSKFLKWGVWKTILIIAQVQNSYVLQIIPGQV